MTTPTVLRLSVLADSAVRLTRYRYGEVCVLPASRVHRTPVFRGSVDDIKAPEHGLPDGDLVAFITCDPTWELEAEPIRSAVDVLENMGRSRSRQGNFDVVAVKDGVDLYVRSSAGWLHEPSNDSQSHEDLERLMKTFTITDRGRPIQDIDLSALRQARQAWRQCLNRILSGDEGVELHTHPSSLQAGSVRDAILVWAVGEKGSDYQPPHQPFVPPRHRPHMDRIEAAYEALSWRVNSSDQGHALACAAYLAWWSGHTRFAHFLFFEANRHGVATRLAELVRRALVQKVIPPWMS